MSLVKVKQLREERAALVKKAQEILAKSDKLSAEDSAQFDLLMADADAKKLDIERWEKIISTEQELSARVDMRAGREDVTISERKIKDEEELATFAAWVRGGMESLSDSQRKVMLARRGFAPGIQAAQGVGTAAGGGALVPQAFSDRLEVALKMFGGMLGVAEVIETDTGADMPWPTVNDTNQVGAIVAENVAITAQDITFSSVTLKSFMYTSKLIAVSLQLMQDSFFSVENLVADLAGQRLGRILNTHFTTGAGTTLPFGVAVQATVGKTGIAGQTTSVIYDDLVDLVYSVDRAYRPASSFMCADSTIKVLRKLKDSQNLPLWSAGIQVGEPDRLLGYPVVVNNDVAAMAANARSIVFGALNKYKVRKVRGVSLMRLNERYAEALQVGFFAFARYDGNLIDAGTNPVKVYVNSAT